MHSKHEKAVALNDAIIAQRWEPIQLAGTSEESLAKACFDAGYELGYHSSPTQGLLLDPRQQAANELPSHVASLLAWQAGTQTPEQRAEWACAVSAHDQIIQRIRTLANLSPAMGQAVDAALETLAAAISATSAPVDTRHLTDLINEHFGHAYWCNREWSAWQVGTMTEDDFSLVSESDVPSELAEFILSRFPAAALSTTSSGDAPADRVEELKWPIARACTGAEPKVFDAASVALAELMGLARRAAPSDMGAEPAPDPLQPQWVRADERLPDQARIVHVAYTDKAAPNALKTRMGYLSNGKWTWIYSDKPISRSTKVLYWLEEVKTKTPRPTEELAIYSLPVTKSKKGATHV